VEVLEHNHPGKVQEDVRSTIANYAIDIFERLNFLVGMLMACVGAIVSGLERQSLWYLLIAICIFLILLYVGIMIFLKAPVGSLPVGKNFWGKRTNRMNILLIVMNLALIIDILVKNSTLY
jgi:hypothetical protein